MSQRIAQILTFLGLFGAGAAALVYQVVTSQLLTRFVGGDHLATGVTLAVFLGGLALGYALCGGWTRRVRRHFWVYAALELLIGAWALFVPTLSSWLEGWTSSWSFSYPFGLVVQGVIVASLLTLPATILMGATVPFMTRGLARSRATVSRTHAWAYGINTAGAAAGALIAGFAWVPAIGLTASLRRMALLNVCVAALFFVVGLLHRTVDEEAQDTGADVPALVFSRRRIYWMGALNGLAVLIFETVMIRYWWRVQVGATVTLMLLWPTLDLWPYGAHLLRIGFQGGPVAFAFYYAAMFVALLLVLGLPIALLGATLPLLFHELRSDVDRSGVLAGRLLAFNGLGTLVGSLVGSFLLFELLDIPGVWLMVPLIVAVNSWLAKGGQRGSRWLSPALVVLTLVIWVVQPFHDPDPSVIGNFRMRFPVPYSLSGPSEFYSQRFQDLAILARDDDPTGTVAVVETTHEEGDTSRSLFVNGRSESDTKTDAATLMLSAHLPALFSVSRDRALVVGVGTGVTIGQLALYDDIQEIVVAEISPAAIDFLPHFEQATGAVHRDPRLRVRMGDAQLVLRQEKSSFDIVISEPSNPWVTGVGQLFTHEFYQTVRGQTPPARARRSNGNRRFSRRFTRWASRAMPRSWNARSRRCRSCLRRRRSSAFT